MLKNIDSNKLETNNISIIAKGVLFAFATSVILLLIFSTVLTYTNVPESASTPVIIIITAISILLSSEIATKKIKKNGIANGAIIGGIYIISLYLISSIVTGNFSLGVNAIVMILGGLLAGIIGGIVGVNAR